VVNDPTKTVAKNAAAPQIWFLFEVVCPVPSRNFQSAELANRSRKLPLFRALLVLLISLNNQQRTRLRGFAVVVPFERSRQMPGRSCASVDAQFRIIVVGVLPCDRRYAAYQPALQIDPGGAKLLIEAFSGRWSYESERRERRTVWYHVPNAFSLLVSSIQPAGNDAKVKVLSPLDDPL
jgi:hypothetical protein